MTDETIKQMSDRDILINIASRLDSLEKRFDAADIQFEAIRSGIVAGSADFDRLTAKVLNLSADVKDLTEEVRRGQGNLSLK